MCLKYVHDFIHTLEIVLLLVTGAELVVLLGCSSKLSVECLLFSADWIRFDCFTICGVDILWNSCRKMHDNHIFISLYAVVSRDL